MHEVEDLGNRLKLEGTVSRKKSDALSPQSEDSSETTAQFIELHYRPIDPHRAIRCDLHDEGFPRTWGIIMKITSSTSKISMSGITLTSG